MKLSRQNRGIINAYSLLLPDPDKIVYILCFNIQHKNFN